MIGVLNCPFLFVFDLEGQVSLIAVGFCVDIFEVNLKLDKDKKIFSINIQLLFIVFFGVCIELNFLFNSLKVSVENEYFDKFLTFSDDSDLYHSLTVCRKCLHCLLHKVKDIYQLCAFLAQNAGVEAIFTFFGLSPVMLCVQDRFKIRILVFDFCVPQTLFLS